MRGRSRGTCGDKNALIRSVICHYCMSSQLVVTDSRHDNFEIISPEFPNPNPIHNPFPTSLHKTLTLTPLPSTFGNGITASQTPSTSP